MTDASPRLSQAHTLEELNQQLEEMASKLGDANALVAEGEGARKARDDAELKLQAMGEARMRNVAAIEALDDKLAEEQLARENAEAALAAALADAAASGALTAALRAEVGATY